MSDDFRQDIHELLREIPTRQLEGLRDLWAELGYRNSNDLISTRTWPQSETAPLTTEPRIIATAADFHIIYCQLKTPQLYLTPQRPIISRLMQNHPYSLFVFSNDKQSDWHLVNVKYDEATETRRRVFRRLRIGRAERLRTATERITMLDVESMPDRSALTIQQRHDEAFDVEAVTKAFYTKVALLFTDLVGGERKIGSDKVTGESLLQLPSTPDDQIRKEFGVRLIGRLLFCWFLRKKQSDKGESLIPDALFSLEQLDYPLGIYHSLLEPLFFETLNKRLPDRKPDYQQGHWAKIPFLNGGLFEPQANDFYHPNHINTLIVPDNWLKALFELFEHYNFTIQENTPLDIEVAVDPEMLGKIFENLLAEINPETGESARKATGSYYTPRSIVEYMIDESLKLYLQTKLPDILTIEALDTLFSYETMEHPFEPAQTQKIIQALDELKILDPACGSGAFPMGVLQKVLLLLQKLDPNNQQWKARQLENARHIPDPTARNQVQQTIERAFANKQLDYGRKLYLIQNCIYGVDIQSIAVEIAKLRCFLSLIIDEHVDDSLDNRGVLALPNLEFHFVCANALIGLGQSQQYGVMQAEIEQLKQLALDYLTSYGPEKDQIKAHFAQVQQAMGQKLANWGGQTEALQLLNWHPFEHEPCDWFDPALMLGVREGFDIVLANPPYVRQELIKHLKPALKKGYPEVYTGTADLLVYFYARALQLLRPQGMMAFITSNKFMRAGYGKKLRAFLGQKTSLQAVIDFGDLPVFEATAYPMVLVSRKQKPTKEHTLQALTVEDIAIVTNLPAVVKQEAWPQVQTSLTKDNWNLVQPQVLNLMEKLRASGTTLDEYVEGKFYRGVVTGYNKAFVIDQATRDRLIVEDSRSVEVIKPWVAGRDVKRWYVEAKEYILFIPWHFPLHNNSGVSGASKEAEIQFRANYPAVYQYLLKFKDRLSARNKTETGIRYEWYALQRCAATYHAEFEKPKIVWGNLATKPKFAFDKQGYYISAPANLIPTNDLFLFSMLNSSICQWLISLQAATRSGGFLEYKPMYVGQLPIATPSPTHRADIESLVQKCLDAKGKGIAKWEAEINRLVYEVYDLTPKEIAIIEESIK